MDYPTPDSSTSQHPAKLKRSDSESDFAQKPPRKRQKWAFKPLVWSGPEVPQQDLCQRCQTIDFSAIFKLRINRKEGIPVFDFGQHPSSTESSCPMCAYLVGELSKTKNKVSRAAKNGWHLRAHRSWSLATKHSVELRYGIALRLHPGRPVKSASKLGYRCSLLIAAPEARGPWPEDQTLSRPSFSLKALRGPLKFCIETHECTPMYAPVLPDSTKFIDCKTRKLVFLPSDAQYVTLSYVWGKQVRSEEEARNEANFVRDCGCLPSKTPQTIEDAIRAVVLSQQRYLWVDRYCIDQYHSTHKQIQISAMADIYEGALFTIIALGDNADSGLPGISRPFNTQLRFKVHGYEYLSTGQPLQYHLEQSTWAQRAWVYQEAVLSRRCLIFTPEQAFLTCLQSIVGQLLRKPIAREMTDREFQDREYFNLTIIRPLQHTAEKDEGYGWLQSHLDEYNRRSMTRSTDALNAFKGILSRSGLPSWWGIPIHQHNFRYTFSGANELTSRFVTGLLWRRQHPATEVEDNSDLHARLPSWAWASQRGSMIAFPQLRSIILEHTIFCPELLVVRNSGAERVALGSFAEGQTHLLLPESASVILLTTYSIKIDIESLDRLVDARSEEAVPLALLAIFGFDGRRRSVSWDYDPGKLNAKATISKRVRVLLMRITAHESTYTVGRWGFAICEGAALSRSLTCDWLIVEEFEGNTARRLGVMTTELRSLETRYLTWRSIELG